MMLMLEARLMTNAVLSSCWCGGAIGGDFVLGKFDVRNRNQQFVGAEGRKERAQKLPSQA